jgi:ABC-type nitrate/sulfonate/bicarbonate transport system substrate-binding protein
VVGMKMPRHGARTAAFAALSITAALSAAVSGCSSSSGTSTGGSTTGNASSVSVTLGNPAATYGEAAYVVADKQGYLTKNNVTSKSVLLSSSSTLLAALVSGGVDFGTTNGAAVLAARAKGVPVVAVCGLSSGVSGLALVVSPKLMKSLNLVGGDVNGDLRKLKGQVIGVNSPTATGGRILSGLMQDAGLPKNWLTETSIASSTMVAALQHGEIAGFFENIPVPQQAAANGSGTVAFDTSQVTSLKDIQYNVIATSESFLQSHPDAVKQFLAGIKQGEADLAARKQPALNDLGGIYQGVNPTVVQNAAIDGIETNCAMPPSAWNSLASVAAKWDLIPSSMTAAQVQAAYKTGL